IIPVQHYRYNHDDITVENPLKVSFKEPLTVSSIIIIDSPKKQLGIAIKKKKDESWRVYWASNKDLVEAPVADDVGVIYLPPYETLPVIKEISLK
ncbi:MAG: hypothetical protein WCQ99_11875, partial [Pseudomonadota bacterium]